MFILFAACSSLSQNDPSFKVELSKDKVEAAEAFEYKINIEIESQEYPKVLLPEFKDFKVISQSTSQSRSYKAGKAVLSIQLYYILVGLKEGKFTLPAASLEYREKTLTSPSRQVEVQGSLPEFEEKEFKKIPRGLLDEPVSI